MKLGPISRFCASLIFAISLTSRFPFISTLGFTIDLIHRDFIQSPSLISSSQRVINALRRFFVRVDTLKQRRVPKRASTEVFSDKGEYLMRFFIGTPPVETLAVADTGSDVTWIQCKPCTNCYTQKAPLFEPKLSSTYRPISCTSTPCTALLGRTSCDRFEDTCRYTIRYGDSSVSSGCLAKETVTLGPVAIHDVVIGCGHDDRGTFGAAASGIVGLGGGETSLITQMGPLTQGKFSYCLGSYASGDSHSSKMSFGDDAVVSGDDVITTAIVTKTPHTFYFLTLEGISVGGKRVDYYTRDSASNGSSGIEEGNIVIDSGTTLTFLPKELYDEVVAEVERLMKHKEMQDPEGLLSLCYASSRVGQVPRIVLHFRGGDLRLKPENTFARTGRNIPCLGFAAARGEAIYGNLAQMGFLVGYDLEKKTVSFKPKDCSKT